MAFSLSSFVIVILLVIVIGGSKFLTDYDYDYEKDGHQENSAGRTRGGQRAGRSLPRADLSGYGESVPVTAHA